MGHPCFCAGRLVVENGQRQVRKQKWVLPFCFGELSLLTASRVVELSGCFLFLCGGLLCCLLCCFLCGFFRGNGGAARLDYADQFCADGGAEAGAGVPAGAGLEAYGRAGVVGAGGDVVEGGFAFGGVDGGLDEAGGLAVLCVGDGDEAGPERRDGAGAADDHVFAVDADGVAGGGVGVARDVWNAAAADGVGGLGDAGAGLPGGQREDVADAAAGCAFVVGELVPDDLGGDGGAAAQQFGSSAGEHVRAGGGEVDMVLASGDAVGGAVVAGGDGDGDAEGCGGLACGVECCHGLAGPGGFGGAPADGDDAGFVFGVVDGVADGVDEALVGVGGEVDGDVGAGRDGGGDLDVEHDFAVGAVGVGGGVLGAVDRDCGDLGCLLAEGLEVGGEIGGPVASA